MFDRRKVVIRMLLSVVRLGSPALRRLRNASSGMIIHEPKSRAWDHHPFSGLLWFNMVENRDDRGIMMG